MHTSMMTSCALLLLLVAVPALTADAKLGCCMPNAWKGTQLTNVLIYKNARYYASRAYAKVTYDAANQREKFEIQKTDSNGNQETYSFLAFYAKKIAYKIKGLQCTSTKVEVAFPKRCVPSAASAKILNADVIVGEGDHALNGTRVAFKVSGQGYTSSTDLLVTDGCIPVSDSAFLRTVSAYMMSTNSYENIKVGGVSDADFTIPASCNAGNM